MKESVTKTILETLGDFLDNRVNYRDVLYDWPEANVSLQLPTLCITTGSPEYTQLPRFVLEQGAMTAAKQSDVVYGIGQYEWNLQLDIWCRSKEERYDRQEELMQAFNSQEKIGGLSIFMPNYHNILARYDMVSYLHNDSESTAQTKEWRLTCNVLAHCFAAIERKEYIIETAELGHFSTPDEITD